MTGGRADWSDRVVAPGSLPAAAVTEYLRACDLVIQPYPDGVSSRRGTAMAALANGVPVVTTFRNSLIVVTLLTATRCAPTAVNALEVSPVVEYEPPEVVAD